MHRTEKSDECVPNKPVQTTRSTPLTLSSQPRSVQTETNAGISTTKETVKVLSTKGREENGGSDGSNKDTIILVSVLISLAVTALLVLLIAIRLRRESQQNTPEAIPGETVLTQTKKRKSLVKKIAGSYIKMKVINSTVHFDSAHPNTTKEPHETSFINGIDRPTSAAINDQDTDDTEDKPFLQGPRAHPNTTEEQQETSFINGIDRPTSAAINDQDTDATEDKPFLQGPRHEENRPPKSTNTTATAPIPVTSHVLGGKISEKKLSPCVDPVYPSVGAYTAGATFCPNRDGATATEELDERTNGQATPCVIGDIESVEKLQESDSDEKSDFDTDSGSQEETISFLDETASKHM
ncbi:hypothetical protein MAR_038371 [Mya arenaria]|uniref:Uncharacterized protein n=1 Tax=Mya arenaria TaxID=6604 RepID=A0ABY7FUG8_MYAAR|nr:hypothetical protein MAR_038371 [Mya arenaria]